MAKLKNPNRVKQGRRNRQAGNRYEVEESHAHKVYFHSVVTTRSCNRHRDGEKLDLCNLDEYLVGRLPLDIQCKTTTSLSYHKFLNEMADSPDRIKVLLHRRTKKGWNRKEKKPGNRIMAKGDYAILERKGYEVFLQHFYAMQLVAHRHPEVFEAIQRDYPHLNLIRVPQQIKV